MSGNGVVLELKDVHTYYGAIHALKGISITVREGEVLHIPSWVPHQAEAIDDTFEMDIFSPIRHDWLDGTDKYFHDKPTEK